MASEVRQRRMARFAKAELPADAAAAAEEDSTVPKKLHRIDCTKGHVGITCCNHLDPPGVLMEFCDPADLAYKAGLRVGDVVVTINGAPVTKHEELIEAINAATAKKDTEEGRCLDLAYIDAKSVAAVQAAALTSRPSQKSLLVAYFLLLCAPPLGLQHFYLGRDGHCILHLTSLGGLGLGCLRDFFCLPRYVSLCNEAPEATAPIKVALATKPVPSRGFSRMLAMLLLGYWYAYVAGCLLPSMQDAPWHPIAGIFLEGLLQAGGGALAIYLVGTCPPVDGSFNAALRSAVAAAAGVRFLFGWRSGFWAAVGAVRGFGKSMSYVRPGSAPQRRMRMSVRRRVFTVVAATATGWGCVGVGLYQHGGVTVRSADGGFHTIVFKDAIHHALQSPLLRNMPSLLFKLATEGIRGEGFQEGWKNIYDSLDLAGEAHACEKLGLDNGCLEDWSDVKRAYRQLALEFHPDKQADATPERRLAAEERFREVQEAYEHLQKLHSSKKQEAAHAEARSSEQP